MRIRISVKLMVISMLPLSAVSVINARNITGSITGTAPDAWLAPSRPGVSVAEAGADTWVITSSEAGEFTLESARRFNAKPTDKEYLSGPRWYREPKVSG